MVCAIKKAYTKRGMSCEPWYISMLKVLSDNFMTKSKIFIPYTNNSLYILSTVVQKRVERTYAYIHKLVIQSKFLLPKQLPYVGFTNAKYHTAQNSSNLLMFCTLNYQLKKYAMCTNTHSACFGEKMSMNWTQDL